MNDKNKGVLGDHIRKGKKLTPRFLATMGEKYAPYSWIHQVVPEIIWIALLIDSYGLRKAVELGERLVLAADETVTGERRELFSKLSSFNSLTTNQQQQIIEKLGKDDINDLKSSLFPLHVITQQSPLRFLFGDIKIDNTDKYGGILADTLNYLYNRNSTPSVLTISAAMYIGISQGIVRISGHLLEQARQNFDAVVAYPRTEESKKAAGFFRASAPMLLGLDERGFASENPWVSQFWEKVAGFGPCLFSDLLQPEEDSSQTAIEKIIIDYRNDAKTDLRHRLQNWPLNFNEIDAFEVIGALLARQTTLAIDLAASPAMWTPHCAPLVLRAMADVFISTAWILMEPSTRAKKYVEDGLGAVKLEIAHRKKEIEKLTDKVERDRAQEICKYWESWLQSQRMDQFIEVNLGSWSGLNTRKMAEEAGVLDFYNYVYQPFSAAVHSNWAHISDKNTLHCENPAHRLHRVATILDVGLDPHWLFLGAKYLQKTFSFFDKETGLEQPHTAAYDKLYASLYGNEEDCNLGEMSEER